MRDRQQGNNAGSSRAGDDRPHPALSYSVKEVREARLFYA